MRYLILLFLLTSCATKPEVITKTIEVKPKFKTQRELKSICFDSMFKLGLNVDESIKACKFTLGR